MEATPRVQADISAAGLLAALDGIVYLTDREGIIRAVGGKWTAFARANGGAALAEPEMVLGRPLSDSVSGSAVRDAYERFTHRLLSGERSHLVFSYRCDGPSIRRHMRLAIGAVFNGGDAVGLLYQSILIRAEERPPIALFDSGVVESDTVASLPLLGICSYCNDVRHPAGSREGDGEWVSAEEYYHRGGRERVALTHTICPRCFTEIVEPQLADD